MPENLTVLPAAPTVNAYEIIGRIDDSRGSEASAIAPGIFNSPGPKSLLRVLKQNGETDFYALCNELDMVLLAWNPRKYQIRPNLQDMTLAEAEDLARVCRGHFPFLMFKDGKRTL